jgi:hypothetical protein
MSIHVLCPCGEEYRANRALAGRTVTCGHCRDSLRIPDPDNDLPAELPTIVASRATRPAAPEVVDRNDHQRPTDQARSAAPLPRRSPEPAAAQPFRRASLVRHLPWLLVLILVPLAWPGEGAKDRLTFEQRAKETIAATPRSFTGYYLNLYEEDQGSIEDVFKQLPEQRCLGAFLPRGTWWHWGFAVAAVALFGALSRVANGHRVAPPRAMLGMALAGALGAATFLVLVGLLTERTWQWSLRDSSYSLLLVPLSNGFDYSFRAALHPVNGLLPSFLGFTLLAGLCEELIKALPLLFYYRRPRQHDWRGALLLGLACGAAFGIVEGALYCREFYNGIRGPGIYLITFLPSVAQHAVWTGCVAVGINRYQEPLRNSLGVGQYLTIVLAIVCVPLLLHGLYDTLLKMHWTLPSIVVAAASLVYCGFLVRGSRHAERTSSAASPALSSAVS